MDRILAREKRVRSHSARMRALDRDRYSRSITDEINNDDCAREKRKLSAAVRHARVMVSKDDTTNAIVKAEYRRRAAEEDDDEMEAFFTARRKDAPLVGTSHRKKCPLCAKDIVPSAYDAHLQWHADQDRMTQKGTGDDVD